MRVAHAAGHVAADQIVGTQVGEHGDLGVEQRHVHLLAFARFLSMPQCGQYADGGIHAGHQISHRNTHFLWAAPYVVALPGHAHQPAHALHCVVVPSPFGIRAGLAKAGD